MLITVLISAAGVNTVRAQSTSDTTDIRAKVDEYGVGKKVSVTLVSGAKYTGRIAVIDDDTFSVKVKKTNRIERIAYEKVTNIKKSSYAKWIIIGAVAAVIIPLSKRCQNEGANPLCL